MVSRRVERVMMLFLFLAVGLIPLKIMVVKYKIKAERLRVGNCVSTNGFYFEEEMHSPFLFDIHLITNTREVQGIKYYLTINLNDESFNRFSLEDIKQLFFRVDCKTGYILDTLRPEEN